MHRGWGLAIGALVCASSAAAFADSLAMPGGLHVPDGSVTEVGTVEVEGLSGFGRRSGLLGEDHKLDRGLGDVAIAYTAAHGLTIAVEFDGRYDKHFGLAPSGDDGYVGDPHFNLRYATGRYGAQLGVWVPGGNAPSVEASAISVDAQVFGTWPAGPGAFSVSAGFRLDNSDASVDDPRALSAQDQVSLGVSSFSEALAGARYAVDRKGGWLGVEASSVIFVGGGAPGPIVRGTVVAGKHFSDKVSAFAYVEAAHVPGIELAQVMSNEIPLIPYEPIFTAGIAVQARFGGPKPKPDGGGTGTIVVEKDCAKHVPPDCTGVKVPIEADIEGVVVDDSGKPVVGATVKLTLKASSVPPATTDDKGAYVFKGVPIGNTVDGQATIDESAAQIAVEVDGKKTATATVPLAKGDNKVAKITMETALPAGELRGVVSSLATGAPISGVKIAIEPGGQTVQSGTDGRFQINLQPGQYKITVTANGFAKQELDVTIDPNGVATKNINMRK